MIEIKVNDSVVSVQKKKPLYSGSVDVHLCQFAFDASWDRFSKSAVFRVGGRAVTAYINEEGCCTLPWELLTRANIGLQIEVGVYGVSAAAEVLTTVWDSIGAVRDGSEIGNDAREPSEGVYEQVMAGIQRVDEKVVSCNEQAQTQVQRAESAAAISQEKAEETAKNAAAATGAAEKAQSALAGVQAALNNLPSGNMLIINDLTTGGTAAALSAEMGRVLGQRPNPNLLHNWYFSNAVNQRGQSEYTATGYTIDRWKLLTAETSLAVGEGITLNHTGSNIGVLRQFIESPSGLYGKTVTISVLMVDGQFVSKTGTFPSAPSGSLVGVANATLDTSGANGRYVAVFLDTDGKVFVNIRTVPGSEMSVAAVKLELGSVQTLAHQDSSGNWVLNEIPDYGGELLKCQRYYQLFSSEDKRPTALSDYRPAMRANPATGTTTIDGVTFYYADANL